MAFNSLQFLLFFPVAVLGYYLVPKRLQKPFLLALSYFFYMFLHAGFVVFILISTLSTWGCALLLSRLQREGARRAAFACVLLLNLGILFVFKYFNMFAELAAALASLAGAALTPVRLSLLLPVGISFYTFQVLGYLIDVYRGTVEAEKNLLDYALFVTFFPQLLSGPIGRADSLLPQLAAPHPFCYDNLAAGLRMMLLGFFKKVLIADNIGIAVDRLFTYTDVFPGPVLVCGMMLYAVQIYCDFGGYCDVAIGAAKVLGIDLARNFDHPYFSQSIAEFWRRWHITLGAWFRDYLFYPVLRSPLCMALTRHFSKAHRRTAAKLVPTAVALAVVWFSTGLWHGAAWTYVAWGCLHGLYQIVGMATQPARKRLAKRTGWDRLPVLPGLVRVAFTFALVCIGYVFFRAGSFAQALLVLTHSVRGWGILLQPAQALGAFSSLADSARVTAIILVSVAVLWAFELWERRKNARFEQLVAALPWAGQWAVYYGMLLAIALFGAFGRSSFIYFQF